MEAPRFFLGFHLCLKSCWKQILTRHKTGSVNDLAIPTPEKGWDRSGKSRKTRSRLEKLRPGSAAPQRNALRDWHSVTRRTEKGHSVPALWTPRTFYFLGGIFVVFFFFPLRKVRSWHKKKKKKSSGSPPCTGTEKGQLCTRKETTRQWGLPSAGLGWA